MREKGRPQTANTKRGDSKTAMGIALTLLAAGIIVQLTAGLELFGHNSVVPLIIGGIVILVGICVVFVLHRMEVARKGNKNNKVM